MPTLQKLNLRHRTLWKNEKTKRLKVHADTSLIELKTLHFVEKRKTYNFAQIQRKISILAPK